MGRSSYPVTEKKFCFPWLFAVSVGRNIMWSSERKIMKVEQSFSYPVNSMKIGMPMAVWQAFCI